MAQQGLKPASEPESEQFSEQRTDSNAGVKIPLAADLLYRPLVIAMNRMVKRKLHETGEGNRTVRSDFPKQDAFQRAAVVWHCPVSLQRAHRLP